MITSSLILVSAFAGGLAVLLVVVLLRRKGRQAPVTLVHTQTVAERIRAVGKLVGLEVHAKEIATSAKGWSWLPPIILSQAKIAMIFHFEKQYFVDLTRLSPSDVEEVTPAPGHPGPPRAADRPTRYRLRLPAVEGTLRLTDVTPYDIQAGRVLGLIDVIQMNAQTQRQLMQAAQEQAATLYERAESRYVGEARRSIERQLASLLALFDAHVEADWGPGSARTPAGAKVAIEEGLEHRLSAIAGRA